VKRWLLLVATVAVVTLGGCPRNGDKPKPVEPQGRGDAQDRLLPVEDGGVTALSPAPPLPALPAGLPALPANPRVTPDAVALGELLFHDGRLSASGARSCAHCHDPTTGYAGGVQRAADDRPNLRRTPALVNLAWATSLGWDGRYASFAAHLPPHLKGQLGDPLEAVVARISAVPVYQLHIARVGGAPQEAIVQALEAYVMTRFEGEAPWDRIERTALTKAGSASADPVVAGYQLFMGKGQCGVCHVPPLYTDHGFHRVAPNPYGDPGHKTQKGAFKTPTLRGAAARPAFFHSGAAKSLDEVVAHYATPIAGADPIAAKIKLAPDEQKQVVAFLNALGADRAPPAKPVLP
jgi:cytochrome c peroxidase